MYRSDTNLLENVLKIQLIEEARKWYAMYSIWAFVLLGAMPDIYNLAIQFNLLTGDSAPAFLARTINTIAFLGAMARLVKQKKLELDANGKLPA